MYLGFPNRYFFEDRLGIHEWEKDVNVTLWLIVRAVAVAGALILPATRRRRSRTTHA